MSTPAPKSMLYTRTGDAGISSLYDGSRHSKTSPIFTALGIKFHEVFIFCTHAHTGDIDELSSAIGHACSAANVDKFREHVQVVHILRHVQCRLLDIGSAIASPNNACPFDEDQKEILWVFH